jgi:apolipoprotein N-acyltransferase
MPMRTSREAVRAGPPARAADGSGVLETMPGARPTAGLAHRVQQLGAWPSRAAALLAGMASVLALAPIYAWPVMFVTLPVLVWLIDGACGDARRPRRRTGWLGRGEAAAAAIGWCFGFGYFLAGLMWIGQAFLVDAATFAVLLPFAVTLLPAGLALYYAAAAAVAARCWRPGLERVLVLALALSAADWLRGHALSGFPWNLLGYALTYPLPLMQSAAYLGVYALGLCAVPIFALPMVVWGASKGRGARRAAFAAAIAIVPLSLAGLLGWWRLSAAAPAVAGVKVRIVQPNVPEREKWRPENQVRIFRDYLALSRTSPTGVDDAAVGITHLIWPEAALPFLVLDSPGARAAIGAMLPPHALLITGALRAEPAPQEAPQGRRVFNSILVFGEGGSLVDRYDKIRLVPFGEYLPMQSVLEAIGLRQLTELRGGFATGATPRPLLHAPGLPPSVPLICYEAVFPHAIVETAERPGVLLNVTNDGWFGDTIGPRQHFHQARVRAVEEGVPLLRAANTGISGVVDAYGRVLQRLGLNRRGTIDTELPPALPPPPYARFGDGLFLVLWLAGAGALLLTPLLARRRRRVTAARDAQRAGRPQAAP